jgi:hypothetical protein
MHGSSVNFAARLMNCPLIDCVGGGECPTACMYNMYDIVCIGDVCSEFD